MKKAISTILLCIAAIAMILMCAEKPDGSVNFWWTGGWMVVAVVVVKIWEKFNPKEKD